LGLGLFEIEIESEASQVGDEKNLETRKSIQRLADQNYSKVSESRRSKEALEFYDSDVVPSVSSSTATSFFHKCLLVPYHSAVIRRREKVIPAISFSGSHRDYRRHSIVVESGVAWRLRLS
jgi:hypothetical protein